MPPRIRLPNCGGRFSQFQQIQPQAGRAAPNIRPYMAKPAEPKPIFSEGTADVDALRDRLGPLLASNGGRWTLANGGEALERTFRFKTFAKTWVSRFLMVFFSAFFMFEGN